MKYFLWLLLIPTMAQASARYELAEGYHMRMLPAMDGRIQGITHGENDVTLLARSGDWSKVCIGGEGNSCRGGKKTWVFSEALQPARRHRAVVEYDANSDSESEASNCPDGSCKPKTHHKARTDYSQVADGLDPNDPRGYKLPSNMFDQKCSKFIGPKGLGEYGRAMVNAAAMNAADCFYYNRLFGSMCPNYMSLPLKKKNALIAMAFAAISQSESTCRPNAHVWGVNDFADGLFQLEHTRAQRARAGRSERFCATKQNVNTYGIKFQSECAVSTVANTVCSWGSNFFDRRGYWQELRGHGAITQRIYYTARMWHLCE